MINTLWVELAWGIEEEKEEKPKVWFWCSQWLWEGTEWAKVDVDSVETSTTIFPICGTTLPFEKAFMLSHRNIHNWHQHHPCSTYVNKFPYGTTFPHEEVDSWVDNTSLTSHHKIKISIPLREKKTKHLAGSSKHNF